MKLLEVLSTQFTPEQVEDAIARVKETDEFKAVTALAPYNSNNALESHGTLSFRTDGHDYLIRQNGQTIGWIHKAQDKKRRKRQYRIMMRRSPDASGPYHPKIGHLSDDLLERYVSLLEILYDFLVKKVRKDRNAALS